MEENVTQKQEKDEKKSCEGLKTIFKYLLGAVLVIGGIALVWIWRGNLWVVVKGCLGLFLIFILILKFAIQSTPKLSIKQPWYSLNQIVFIF